MKILKSKLGFCSVLRSGWGDSNGSILPYPDETSLLVSDGRATLTAAVNATGIARKVRIRK